MEDTTMLLVRGSHGVQAQRGREVGRRGHPVLRISSSSVVLLALLVPVSGTEGDVLVDGHGGRRARALVVEVERRLPACRSATSSSGEGSALIAQASCKQARC